MRRMVPRRLSHLDAGTRFIGADSIRNLGQKDQAAVMPHRNTQQTTSRNGYWAKQNRSVGSFGPDFVLNRRSPKSCAGDGFRLPQQTMFVVSRNPALLRSLATGDRFPDGAAPCSVTGRPATFPRRKILAERATPSR